MKRSTKFLRMRRPRLTYSGVVATMALFIALGGVSWAAVTLPKNSVGSKQLKKNSVTEKKIKRSAVTGAKVKNHSLSGIDINLATLGKVPAAASADVAGTASDDVGITKRINSSATGASESAGRAAAAAVPVLTVGKVGLYAKAFVDTTADVLYCDLIETTSANGALALSTNNSYTGDTAFLDTTTTEDNRVAYSNSTSANSADYTTDSIASLFGPDGVGFQYHVTGWAKHGTITGTSPLVTGADQCAFAIDGKRLTL